MEKTPISHLNLSVRTYRVLKSLNVEYLDQLTEKTASELMDFRNFGAYSLREVRKVLANRGLCLKHDYIASTENEKLLIQDMPRLISDLVTQTHRLIKEINFIKYKLDQLHFDMQPIEKKSMD